MLGGCGNRYASFTFALLPLCVASFSPLRLAMNALTTKKILFFLTYRNRKEVNWKSSSSFVAEASDDLLKILNRVPHPLVVCNTNVGVYVRWKSPGFSFYINKTGNERVSQR